MKRLASILFLSVLVLSIPAEARKKREGSDRIQKKGEISYMCTGIGESRQDPRLPKFPLKLVFATLSGSLYSDVDVRVAKEGGKTVLEVFCEGPWLLVDLPPDRYEVTAVDFRKRSRSCSVTVGTSQTSCVLRWPD
jgi:hypothetical protein